MTRTVILWNVLQRHCGLIKDSQQLRELDVPAYVMGVEAERFAAATPNYFTLFVLTTLCNECSLILSTSDVLVYLNMLQAGLGIFCHQQTSMIVMEISTKLS